MKSYQIKYENVNDIAGKLARIQKECGSMPYSNVIFYLTWTEASRDSVREVTDLIGEYFPKAPYYGNEASGNILNGNLDYGVTVACYIFEDSSTRTKLLWVEEGSQYATLEDLWNFCKEEKGLKAVELIPSIAYLDVLKMDNSIPNIGEDILIFGGASVNYDDATFQADIIAKGHEMTRKGMAVMLYYGRNFKVSATYVLGWKGLGRYMTVTKSFGKTISEIDGTPAHSIYEKYLNLRDDDNANLVFPLIVEEDGVEYIRTPQAFLPDKSMRMFANIPEGSLTRIAYGDKNTILNSLYEKSAEISAFAPQAIKAYSCAARRLFWGDEEVCKETLPIQEIAPMCGFYTGGEILRFGQKLRVLNSTLVLISMREGDAAEQEARHVVKTKELDKSLISRLTFFTERIVEEQEAQKVRLAEQQDQLEESLTFTRYFLNTYISAYYVSLETLACQIYKRSAELERDYPIITNYLESLNAYIATDVHPDDREELAEILQPETLKNILEEQPEYTHYYRDISGGNEKIYRFQAIRGADSDHAAFGFTDITDELRDQQRRTEIIEILASEYSSVYYIDLTTGELNPYTMNVETETTFGSVFRSGITYSEAFRLYVDKLVYPEDKSMMLKAGSLGSIMKELRTKKTYRTTYRDAQGHYSEMKFVKVGNEDGLPTAVALGFADKDQELRAKEEIERVRQRNIDIIEILASEYMSVYYIDLTTDELDPYTMNEQTETQFGKIFRSGIRYSEAFKMYVDTLVYEADKSRMLNAGSIYNILRELGTKKTFITIYRDDEGKYCEMKFVKVGSDENPQAVALGFANKDEEIRGQLERML